MEGSSALQDAEDVYSSCKISKGMKEEEFFLR